VNPPSARPDDLARIRAALTRAGAILLGYYGTRVDVSYKHANSPVTEADMAVDAALRRELPRADEGWLSEESADDRARLERRRVWIVDPLDGTREFLERVPQWNVSIGLVEDGVAVAGGIYNPVTEEVFLGARETGVTLNGAPVGVSERASLDGAVVIANRWAVRRRPGQWINRPFRVRVVNALAYSLALIAAGRADAMWSRSPKAEWDTAAGAALIVAAGGRVTTYDGGPLRFNAWPPHAPGLVASNGAIHAAARRFVARLPPARR
jgi:myo-inositol-1(or 4)-monophosphatase